MIVKDRLGSRLRSGREFTEAILAAFDSPEKWTHKVHENANHALWIAGHLTVSDNFFVSLVAPDEAKEIEGYQAKFGMGSQPVDDPSVYPPPEEVLAHMRERREKLCEVLAALSEDDLAKPTPDGTPDFIPDVASVFETAAWHEGIHGGQATVARRSLGLAPLFAPPAPAEA